MEKTISSQQQSKNYVLPIIIMFALFFMIAFVTGYQNPLGSVIKKMTGGNAILTPSLARLPILLPMHSWDCRQA